MVRACARARGAHHSQPSPITHCVRCVPRLGEDDFGVRVGELSEMSAVADDNERHLVSEMLDRLREEVKTIESEDWMFESSKNAPR